MLKLLSILLFGLTAHASFEYPDISSIKLGSTLLSDSNPLPVGENRVTLGSGTITLSGTANGIVISVPSYIQEAIIEVSGTYSNQLLFEVSHNNGSSYRAAEGLHIASGGGGSGLDGIYSPGGVSIYLKGKDKLRIYGDPTEGSAFSGTASVTVYGFLHGSLIPGLLANTTYVSDPLGATEASLLDVKTQLGLLNSHTQPTALDGGIRVNQGSTGTLASNSNSADQVVTTVQVANKSFHVVHWDVSARLTTYAATATNFGECSLESPAGTKLATVQVANAGDIKPIGQDLSVPLIIPTNVVVRVVCTPSGSTAFTWRANIIGYSKP